MLLAACYMIMITTK